MGNATPTAEKSGSATPYINKKWVASFILLSSMRGRQQLSCPVLRPPSGPDARPQDNMHFLLTSRTTAA